MIKDCQIQFSNEQATYSIGADIRGTVRISDVTREMATGAEISILWSTHGAGTPDSAVVHVQPLDLEQKAGYPFEARLPLLPVTHNGPVIQIGYVARLRLTAKTGPDLVLDQPFTVVA